ncbi:methylmalonyl-CoA mutase family protein [Nonomuraea sp. MCN248]|uniref:methylmalonyl-CoA mutase n=1 Tax=Nonomuraea corallina TaxID=2989783 RepID=A0ABT4S5Z3_9ACTN|nr:methylmalonyl-CoA mutase family protein [Nonomuraea corallina]MDA0632618.1 methylmalonyl-CoA mutase family protein [Nonomuraea corallina]
MELAAGFPSTSRDDWRALATAVLRKSGVDAETPEEALSHSTYDGLAVAPLYDAADLPASAPFDRGARPGGGWDVRQRHALPDPEAVMADLENGVTSLWLVVGDGAIPVSELPRVLKGVLLDLAPVVLEAGELTGEAAEALLALAGDTPLRGNLGASPLSPDAPALAAACAAGRPGLRAVMVDATPYHDAGGGDAEELGCSLALAVAGLRALTAAGLTVQQACDQLEFRYAATDDQFATIAKLRAARRLWDRVTEVTGASGPQRQHAVTSSAMMTARDPWVNMLRTTVACFAAGVGGADAVTVQPFDAVVRRPDAFSRRIARNTQSLLLEEAGVGRVVDPSGGSWYVERRTEELAERAWAWFQEIEAAGGIEAGAELVAGRVAATRERRAADLAHRRLPITGVSEFPDLDEKPLNGAGGGPFLASHSPAALAAGLPTFRYAQEFEELRDLADAQAERPKVFLATIGPVAVHTPRAAFAANLFRAGGLATETAGPGADPEQIATAFAVSGATVACLCSSDKLYGQHAEAVAAALKRAGARTVWLAGKGDYAGVDGRVHAGCDALDVLRTTFRDLEVTR